MSELVLYEAACAAVAAARTVDEAKSFRDKAEALRAYARMAKDKQLEIDATEIRACATRRIGEMMAAQLKSKGAIEPGTNRGTTRVMEKPASLAEAGIDKNLAHAARQLAGISEDDFECTLAAWRDHVSAENERVTISSLKPKTGDKVERRAERERELADKTNRAPDEEIRRHRCRPGMALRAVVARDRHGSGCGQ
jgi:hypothetical protein